MTIKNTISETDFAFRDLHGPVPYSLSNDYLFRAVLQQSNKALRGLICSLLHLTEADIVSVRIINPIILGESAEDKEFRLDVNINLNDNIFINLEMQLANRLNWKNRSLVYLCRSFDRISRRQDYKDIHPVIHIGFLDYPLFPEHPEFYSTFRLINPKTLQVYSSNFTLRVIDLTHTNLATEEDKRFHIDNWAKLFKATTWEEIKMLASENEYIKEAAKTMFELSADEQIRKRCLDREEYYQDLRNYEHAIAQAEGDLTMAKKELSNTQIELADTQSKLSNTQTELSDTQAKLLNAQAELAYSNEKLSQMQKIAEWAKEHGYEEGLSH